MPNRSRTSVPSASQANIPNTNPKAAKAKALQEAHAMGRCYAASWAQLDPSVVQARPLEAWRAIGYADAVLSFEHSPLLAELMRAWEQGLDGTSKPMPPVAPVTNAQPDPALPATNPFYANPDRAPYELGHLLQQLPTDFGMSPVVDAKHVQMATAAEAHAHIAGNTIWSGIEAIAHLVEMVGANGEETVPASTLFGLGGLLRHLAVEGHYMGEISESLAYANVQYAQHGAGASTKEADHA